MILDRLVLAVAGAILMLSLASPALAQMSIDDIEAALENSTGELERVDAILADPDQNRRIAGMQLLLASGNPLYVQRARVAGLLSSDPDMQIAALKATLDAGGAFRIEFDLSGLEEGSKEAWTEFLRGQGSLAADGKSGTFSLNTGAYDKDKNCYPGDYYNRGDCAFRLNGTTVNLPMGNLRIDGTVQLDSTGALVGTFTGTRITQPVPILIPLVE